MEKRPIDKIRDAAGSFKLEMDSDDGGIAEMFPLNDGLLMVTRKGLYESKFADQIDPERVNPQIPPNLQRKILPVGTESELVGRTLLTAKGLFVQKFLPASVDAKKAMSLTFEALKDLVEMDRGCKDYQASEKAEIEKRASCRPTPGSFVLPSITDIEVRCKTFFQRGDHVQQALWDIVRVFYPSIRGKYHFEKLLELAEKEYGKADDFTNFIHEALPFILMVRNVRDCLDHRNAKGVVITNFMMRPDGKISRPGIEIEFRDTKQSKVDLAEFVPQVLESMLNVFEVMITYLCSKNPRRDGQLPIVVGTIPENLRRNKYVRYAFGTYLNGLFMPLSNS